MEDTDIHRRGQPMKFRKQQNKSYVHSAVRASEKAPDSAWNWGSWGWGQRKPA